jgi:hypothetical protein
MFPTRADLFLAARNEVLLKNSLLAAEAVERDGTDVNILIAAGAAMGDKVVGQLVAVAAGLFLDSAASQALDRLVFDRYGMVRKPAAPALVNVAFSTLAPAASSFTIPVGTIISTADGIQFSTVVATSISAGSSGPVYTAATSLLAGANQQIKSGTIQSIVSQITGSPNDLQVTNNAASAGAADRESDDQLRDRARRFWTTAQKGTLAAIVAGARSVPGVVRAATIEVLDGNSRPGRWVLCVVADNFTDALANLNQTSPSYATQSQALATTVFNTLDEFRCDGIFVQVAVAQVALLQVVLSLTFAAGVDPLVVANRARAAISAYVNELDPGASFVPTNALTKLRQVAGLIITGNEIAEPPGAVIPRSLQVLRTTAELIGAASGGLPIAQTIDPDIIVLE